MFLAVCKPLVLSCSCSAAAVLCESWAYPPARRGAEVLGWIRAGQKGSSLPSLPADPSGCTDCSRSRVAAAGWAYFGARWVGSGLASPSCRRGGSPLPAPCSSGGLTPGCGGTGSISLRSSSLLEGGQHHAGAWVSLGQLRGCCSTLGAAAPPDELRLLVNLFLKPFPVSRCVCCRSWRLKQAVHPWSLGWAASQRDRSPAGEEGDAVFFWRGWEGILRRSSPPCITSLPAARLRLLVAALCKGCSSLNELPPGT